MKRGILLGAIAVGGLLLAAGCAPPVGRENDYYGNTGVGLADNEALRAAYSEGFEDACAEVWSNSPDGNLYYAGVAYTEDDCLSEIDEERALTATDEEEARMLGRYDGFDAAFDLSPSGVLCWGEECWTRDDFQ